jgi:hypothetical protein
MPSGDGWAERKRSALRSAWVPGSAYVVAASVSGSPTARGDAPLLLTVVALAVGSVCFVVPAAFVALVVARHRAVRQAVTAAVTAAAVLAGVLVATTDDAQAGLAVFWVSYVALPLALVVWLVDEVVDARRTRAGTTHGWSAPVGDRLAALVIDIVIVGGALAVPLTGLAHAGHEVLAAVVGILVAAAYLGLLVAWRGRTVGHALVGLSVVRAPDGHGERRVGVWRASVRGLIVALEVASAPTVFLVAIAGAELLAAAGDGRSLTDRVLGTRVVVGRPVSGMGAGGAR